MLFMMVFPFLVRGILAAGLALAVSSFAEAFTLWAVFHHTLFFAFHLLVLHHLFAGSIFFAFNAHLIALRLLGLG